MVKYYTVKRKPASLPYPLPDWSICFKYCRHHSRTWTSYDISNQT